jgi:hypothetical protein
MRCSYYRQSFVWIREGNREIRSWIWRSCPAGSVHPELPSFHRSDRCSWPVWPVWALCGICLGWIPWSVCLWVVLLLVSSCFVRLRVGFFFLASCVLEMFLFQGLEKSLRLSLCGCCSHRPDRLCPPVWPAQAIGLTGTGHRSDRHRPSVWPV